MNMAVVKLNGTRQVVVYADDVNILGGRVRTVQKCALIFGSET